VGIREDWERGRMPWLGLGPFALALVSSGEMVLVLFWRPATFAPQEGGGILSMAPGIWWSRCSPRAQEQRLAVETEDPTSEQWRQACEFALDEEGLEIL